MNSKLAAVEGEVTSGIMVINDENLFACIIVKKCGKMRLFFIKLSLIIQKDNGNGTSCVPS